MPDRQPPRLGHRALPDFIIIGAQKSATTSLLAYMSQHRQVSRGVEERRRITSTSISTGVRSGMRGIFRAPSLCYPDRDMSDRG